MGAQLTVGHERYADLGAKISWFRSGYLALVAVTGYELALDPAFENRPQADSGMRRTQDDHFQVGSGGTDSLDGEADSACPRAGMASWLGRRSLGDILSISRARRHVRFMTECRTCLDPIIQYSYRYIGWPSKPTFAVRGPRPRNSCIRRVAGLRLHCPTIDCEKQWRPASSNAICPRKLRETPGQTETFSHIV